MSNKFLFSIAIGDWSGDGHDKCDYIHFESNKLIKEVREAYFKAREEHKDLCPENFCSDYEDYTIDAEDMDLLLEKFPGLEDYLDDEPEEKAESFYINVSFMAELTRRFILLGDPELTLEPMLKEEVPTLHFYGKDPEGRHIDFIGYGVMGS